MMRCVLLGLALVLLACSGPSTRATHTETPPPEVRLTLVALNDFHGGLYEQPSRSHEDLVLGGLPWLAGALTALRDSNPNLLVLDGGDLFQGPWPVNATLGRGAIEAYNLLGVDAAAIGNHEFDYGPHNAHDHPRLGALLSGLKEAQFSWLSANIVDATSGAPWRPEGLAPWTLIQRAGVSIAVIGLSTTETPTTTRPRYVTDLRFTDVVESVRALLPEIEASGAQVVVVVGHLTGSCEPAGELEIAETCQPDGEIGRLLNELPPGTLDVIVAGHAHTLMAHRIDQTFVLENRSQGRILGRVELVVTPEGVDADRSRVLPPLPLLHTPADPGCGEGRYDLTPQNIPGLGMVTPSAPAIELVERLEDEAGSLCTPVGCSLAEMTRDRKAESPVGNLVAEAMLAAFPGRADVAVQNGGGLRADLPEGTLRREHIQAVMPFDNRLYLVDLRGDQLELMLRIGSSGRHSLLQIAGARYHLDPSLTTGSDIDGDGTVDTWEYNRLCSSEVAGAAIDPTANYRVVVTDFLMNGGDHLTPVFDDTVTILEEGPLLRDALEAFVIQAGDACLNSEHFAPSIEAPRIVQSPCP